MSSVLVLFDVGARRNGVLVNLVVVVAGLLAGGPTGLRAETITVDGVEHPNAEMAEIGEPGVYFRIKGADYVVLPWDQLSGFQVETVKSRFRGALENLRDRAVQVEGTVFDRVEDGTIVKVAIDIDDGAGASLPYRDGAKVAKGMVIIKDLQDQANRKNGDRISGVFYQVRTYTYQMGGFNLIKEIPYCTQARPEWARTREWTNTEGRKILARVIGVNEGRCIFDQGGGKTFPYEIAKLSESDRALIEKLAKRLAAFPVF